LAWASWVDTAGTYNDFTLNANGISNISKTGITYFGARDSLDTANTTPTGNNNWNFNSSNGAGTTTDPKLVVTYTTGGGTNHNLSLTGAGA